MLYNTEARHGTTPQDNYSRTYQTPHSTLHHPAHIIHHAYCGPGVPTTTSNTAASTGIPATVSPRTMTGALNATSQTTMQAASYGAASPFRGRDFKVTPLYKLSVELLNTYKHINEVFVSLSFSSL